MYKRQYVCLFNLLCTATGGDALCARQCEAPDKIKLTISSGTTPNFIDTGTNPAAYTYETAFRDSDHILVTGTQKNDGIYEIAHSPKAVTTTQLNVRQAVRDENDEDNTAEAVIYRQRCQVRSVAPCFSQ